jgi:hypothetical protein
MVVFGSYNSPHHALLGSKHTCSAAHLPLQDTGVSGGLSGEYMHMRPLLLELRLSVLFLCSYCCCLLALAGEVHACCDTLAASCLLVLCRTGPLLWFGHPGFTVCVCVCVSVCCKTKIYPQSDLPSHCHGLMHTQQCLQAGCMFTRGEIYVVVGVVWRVGEKKHQAVSRSDCFMESTRHVLCTAGYSISSAQRSAR